MLTSLQRSLTLLILTPSEPPENLLTWLSMLQTPHQFAYLLSPDVAMQDVAMDHSFLYNSPDQVEIVLKTIRTRTARMVQEDPDLEARLNEWVLDL